MSAPKMRCPHCDGEGVSRRQADALDIIAGDANRFGEVVSTCWNCAGTGEVDMETNDD